MEIQEFSEKGPDVDAIKKEFDDAKADLSFWMDKAEQGRECRFNEWAGKDESGKKNGPEAFPWDGASDLEANLIKEMKKDNDLKKYVNDMENFTNEQFTVLINIFKKINLNN